MLTSSHRVDDVQDLKALMPFPVYWWPSQRPVHIVIEDAGGSTRPAVVALSYVVAGRSMTLTERAQAGEPRPSDVLTHSVEARPGVVGGSPAAFVGDDRGVLQVIWGSNSVLLDLTFDAVVPRAQAASVASQVKLLD